MRERIIHWPFRRSVILRVLGYNQLSIVYFYRATPSQDKPGFSHILCLFFPTPNEALPETNERLSWHPLTILNSRPGCTEHITQQHRARVVYRGTWYR